MRMFRKIKTIPRLRNIKLGEHYCCIYKTREEQLSILIPYITDGIEQNQKCVYIFDETKKEDFQKELERRGMDVQAHLESKQLVFLTKTDAYLKGGSFDPDRMFELLASIQDEAIKEGFDGLRVTGEMTWVFSKAPGVERLIEYETKLNYFLPKSKTIAICQYNEGKFSPKTLLEVVYTHPYIFMHNRGVKNPFHIPPDDFLEKAEEDGFSRKMYELFKTRLMEEAKKENDVTQAKDYFLGIETALETSEENLRKEVIQSKSLLENFPSGAMIVKKETREVLYLNKQAKITFNDIKEGPCYKMCIGRDEPCKWCLAPEVWATNETRTADVAYGDNFYKFIWMPQRSSKFHS